MNKDTQIHRLQQMIAFLMEEKGEAISDLSQKSEPELEEIWRGLVNVRSAGDVDPHYLELEEAYLKQYHTGAIVGMESCQDTNEERIKLYHGDLCHLEVDAIVNAANSNLLGCFIPNHRCIDNAIHTFAGVKLRECCHQIQLVQEKKEPVGSVKVTPSFHLPCEYIFHTVGPFIPPGKPVTTIRKQLLEKCYISCLKKAEEMKLESIAFCGISTGQFGFPVEDAAQIAVSVVKDWSKQHTFPETIILSTFTNEEQMTYGKLLQS